MTLSQPIVPHSLVDEAFERLADAIAAGEIQPGERIREAMLARQLGISRAVLREALQRLESMKLVVRTANVGVHVVRPTREDLYELYTLLEALDGMAARLAAIHMSEKEILELEALLELDQQEPEQDRPPPRGVEEFHCRVARGSGNARLERMLCRDLRYQLRLYGHRVRVRPGWPRAAFAERKEVLQAIRQRDPELAEKAIRTHVRHWRANLVLDDDSQDAGPVRT